MENQEIKKKLGFYYIGDKQLPAVTTVIERTLAKPQLLYWFGSVGNEEANRISAESKSFGSAMHKFIAEYLRTGQMPLRGTLASDIKQAWDIWYRWWLTVDAEFRYYGKEEGEKVEEVIHNDDYAGTCDFFAQGWLFDWKFGGGLYPEHKIQAGAYARLLDAKEAKIIRVAKDEKNIEVLELGRGELEEAARTFDNLLEVFWWLRKGKK